MRDPNRYPVHFGCSSWSPSKTRAFSWPVGPLRAAGSIAKDQRRRPPLCASVVVDLSLGLILNDLAGGAVDFDLLDVSLLLDIE